MLPTRMTPQRDSLIEATYMLLASGTPLVSVKSLERAALGHCSEISQHFLPSETCVDHPANYGNGKVRFPSDPSTLV